MVTIGTALVGIVPGVLYLISGIMIMGLVRRPPVITDPPVVEASLDENLNNFN